VKGVNQYLSVAIAVYGGMVIGVSLIAAPAKFLANGLALPVALEVGVQTFRVFSALELLIAPPLILGLFFLVNTRAARGFAGLLLLLIALEQLWLMPALTQRVVLIQHGVASQPTLHHACFIASEICKIGLLLTAAIHALDARIKPHSFPAEVQKGIVA
jgi:hypothetical protein